jgi:ABC-2 type transport system permease protein
VITTSPAGPASPAAGARIPPAKPVTMGSAGSFRHYRQLTLELAISQFKLRYTQSVLGYMWSLLKPALVFGITYVIFVVVFQIRDGTPDYGIQFLLGIVIWTFFADCIAASMQAIASSAGLLRKAYFPRSILVIAASFTSLFTFLINLSLVIVIALALRSIQLGPRSLLAIPLLFELYLLVLGISFFLSALFVRFRDVGHLWEVFTQVLFYGSGVMFSLTYVLQRAGLVANAAVGGGAISHLGSTSIVKYVWAVVVIAANPIMQIIEDLRHALITPQAPWTLSVVTGNLAAVNQVHPLDAPYIAPVPYLIVLAVFALGTLTFRARAKNFAQDM